MNIENIPEEYFDLLREKKYSDLSKEEEVLVLKWISKEDYDAYHYLIMESIINQGGEAVVVPDFSLKKNPLRPSLGSYRMPLSSVAAILGFTIFVTALATFYLSDRTALSTSKLDSIPTLSIEDDDYPMNFIIEM